MGCVTLYGAELCCLLPMDSRELCAAVNAMLAAGANRGMPDVELLLVRDEAMAHYNAEHMGLPGPTNVLSFPAASQESKKKRTSPDAMPASVILSVDTLQREAFLYRQPEREHLLCLLAHGLGHVAGFDHGREMEEFCCSLLKCQD